MDTMGKAESSEAYRMLESFDASPAPTSMKSMRADTPRDPAPAKKRMVHYNGYARLRSPKPQELIDQARALVIGAGGYVEQIREGNASFRVPAKEFHGLFKKILTLGDVLSKNITANDVTDSYSDIDLKLKIAKASRNRYIELLNQSDDEEEKLSLLKEISRLNESIEAMENMLKTLSSLAEFARLNLDVVGIEKKTASEEKPDILEFKWIHELSPFSRTNLESGEKLAFDPPKDMVPLGGKKWIAESADGVVFWAYRKANVPVGDSNFWISAVKNRLESEFKSTTVKSAGQYISIRWESLSDKPYVYVLGLYASGRNLDVFEIYYPTLDHEKRFEAAITETLVKGSK